MEPTGEEIQKAYSILLNSMVNVDSCYYPPYHLERVYIGNIPISSGKIQVRDPFSKIDHRQALQIVFPIGEFPVYLGLAYQSSPGEKIPKTKYCAFAYICFSDEPACKWEPATFDKAQSSTNNNSIISFISESTFAMYLDMEHAANYEKIYINKRAQLIDELVYPNGHEKIFTCRSLDAFDATGTAVIFNTNDEGDFISFIGKNNQGKICHLVTDLYILEP